MIRKILKATLIASSLFSIGQAAAQTYPVRNVVVMANFPGGVTEAIKRAIFAKVKDNTGANLVFEARGGGGGAPMLQALKNAAPDGYTLGISYQSAINLNPIMNADLNIDPLNDFVPVMNMFSFGNVILGLEGSAYKDIRDMVAAAKAKPESVKLGILGAGNRFTIALLQERTGAKFLLVPFKGSTDILAATLGGQVDAHFDTIGTLLGQKGKLKGMAFGGAVPSPQAPGVPSLQQLYNVASGSWFAVFAPAKTPDSAVQWMAEALRRAVRDPKITEMIESNGYQVVANTQAEFAKSFRTEVDENKAMVKKYPEIR